MDSKIKVFTGIVELIILVVVAFWRDIFDIDKNNHYNNNNYVYHYKFLVLSFYMYFIFRMNILIIFLNIFFEK